MDHSFHRLGELSCQVKIQLSILNLTCLDHHEDLEQVFNTPGRACIVACLLTRNDLDGRHSWDLSLLAVPDILDAKISLCRGNQRLNRCYKGFETVSRTCHVSPLKPSSGNTHIDPLTELVIDLRQVLILEHNEWSCRNWMCTIGRRSNGLA